MNDPLRQLVRDYARCFAPRYATWHALAIALTAACVMSGFDGAYYAAAQPVRFFLFPAVMIGGLVPIVLPAVLVVSGAVTRDARVSRDGWALAYAAFMGVLLSFTYKALTGRAHPDLASVSDAAGLSRDFAFGFFRRGVFWGWPSSHATVAFAMAGAIRALYPKNRLLNLIATATALYVGIGVSVSIHWFSDSAAGAIFGTIAGGVTAKSARRA